MLQLFFLQLKLLHFLEYFVRLDFFLLNMYFKIFSAAFLLNYHGSLENLTQKCLNSFSLIVEVCSEKCLCLTESSEPFHTRTHLGFLGLNPTRQGSHGKIFLFFNFFFRLGMSSRFTACYSPPGFSLARESYCLALLINFLFPPIFFNLVCLFVSLLHTRGYPLM